MPAAKRNRNWIFVINNDKFDDLEAVIALPVRYCVFGFEKAPTTGTPHIQGYCQFKEAKTMSSVSKMLPRASLRAPDGTPQENRNYCMKPESKDSPDDWYEYGEIGPGAGYRSDMEEIREMLLENPVSYVAHNRFSQWSQYRRSFDVYSQMVFKPVSERAIVSYDVDEDFAAIMAATSHAGVYGFREFDCWQDYEDEPYIIFNVMPMSIPFQLAIWLSTGKWMVKGKYLRCLTIFIPKGYVKEFDRFGIEIISFQDLVNGTERVSETSCEFIPEENNSEEDI
nr:MAG: replication associated protein [Cressdnaviricota sp.]